MDQSEQLSSNTDNDDVPDCEQLCSNSNTENEEQEDKES
jgi:hypothetical protein